MNNLSDIPTAKNKRSPSRWHACSYFLLVALGLCCVWSASIDEALAGSKAQIPLGSVLSGVVVEDSGLSPEDVVGSDVLDAQRGASNWITVAAVPGVPVAKVPSITLWDELRPSPAQSGAASSAGQSINQRTVQIR